MYKPSRKSISTPTHSQFVTVGNKENFDRPLEEFGAVNEIEIERPAPPPPPEPMPEASETDMAKAKEVLAAAVAAHGGLEKLQALKNVVMEGRATANSPMGPMDLDIKEYIIYPDKVRQDIKMPQGEMGIVFDGTSGFALTPMGAQPLPPEMTAALKDDIFRQSFWLLANLLKGR